MNDPTDDLEQADEDVLSHTVSDEALEAAAATDRGAITLYNTRPVNYLSYCGFPCC
jgi:hypothetical protein